MVRDVYGSGTRRHCVDLTSDTIVGLLGIWASVTGAAWWLILRHVGQQIAAFRVGIEERLEAARKLADVSYAERSFVARLEERIVALDATVTARMDRLQSDVSELLRRHTSGLGES